ncbi:MAG TPA: ABC transporter substrate-binding protein [Candidatus Dormibacteraeota bacterium]|nr:ABC transporter substrate-binding protein [Candidatus Dormibacteraeota bacterium]
MRRLAVLMIVMALAASACGGSGAATPRTMTGTLTIAAFNPFSGPDASFGPEEFAGCYPAIQLINRAGGVLGHPLECLNVDTHGDPVAGELALRNLLASTPNLVAILGPSSDESVPTVPLIDAAHIPMFLDAGQRLYDRTSYQYLWRLTASDDGAGYALAIWAYKQGYRRGATLFGNDTDQTTVPTLLKGFRQLGGTIVINEPLVEGKTSYAGEVAAVIQARPDVIFTEIDPPSAAAFLSEFVKRQPAIPIVGTQATAQPDWLQAVSRSIGAHTLASTYAGVQPYAAPQGRPWEIFNDALLAAGPAVPNPGQWSSDPYAIANYDAVTIAALAMVEAGTTDPRFYNRFIKTVTDAGANAVVVHSFDEGITALAGKHPIQYVGPSGPIVFDPWHNVAGGFSVVSYDPSGETKLIGVVDAAALGKLSG